MASCSPSQSISGLLQQHFDTVLSTSLELTGNIPRNTDLNIDQKQNPSWSLVEKNLKNPKFFALFDLQGGNNSIIGDPIQRLLFKIYDLQNFFSLKNKREKLLCLEKLAFLLYVDFVRLNLLLNPFFSPALQSLLNFFEQNLNTEKDPLIEDLLKRQYELIKISSENSLSEYSEDLVYYLYSETQIQENEVFRNMLFVLKQKTTNFVPKM